MTAFRDNVQAQSTAEANGNVIGFAGASSKVKVLNKLTFRPAKRSEDQQNVLEFILRET